MTLTSLLLTHTYFGWKTAVAGITWLSSFKPHVTDSHVRNVKDVYHSSDELDESIVNFLALRKKMAVAGIGWVGWRRGQGPKLTYKARSQYRDFLGERPLVPHLSFNVAADETTGSAST